MFQIYPRRSSRPSCAQLASPAGRNTPKLNTTSKSRKILQTDEDFFGIIFLPQHGAQERIRAGDFYFRALAPRTPGYSWRPATSRNRTQNTPSREYFPYTHPKTLAALARLKRFRISSKEIGESEHFSSTDLRQNRRSIGAMLRTQCQAPPWVSAATPKRSMRHRTLQASGPHRASIELNAQTHVITFSRKTYNARSRYTHPKLTSRAVPLTS